MSWWIKSLRADIVLLLLRRLRSLCSIVLASISIADGRDLQFSAEFSEDHPAGAPRSPDKREFNVINVGVWENRTLRTGKKVKLPQPGLDLDRSPGVRDSDCFM